MARINRIRFAGWMLILLSVFIVSGCATYKASKAFDKAERLSAEEKFDLAIEEYAQAAKLVPSSKTYKLKLFSSRTQAASKHIKQARDFKEKGMLPEALVEYGKAKNLDPGVEVAALEEAELRALLEAEKLAEEAADFYGKRNLLLAKRAVDGALKLDPNNGKALAIKDLLEKRQNSVAMDGIELDVSSDEPITLSFKDANIKEVFGILTQLSGINFIFDEDIRTQTISVLLEKASFAQAMELIMQMNGLGKKVLNSKTIIIYPQTREKEKQYGDQIIQTFFLSHIDAKKAVNLLRTMLQLRKVYVHEERNALILRDTPDVIRLAEQILYAADRSDSEVLFDLELVSVSSGDSLTFGPQLSKQTIGVGMGQVTSSGTNIVRDSLPAAGASVEGLVQSLNNLETFYTIPSATFDFIKTLEDAETLANPKIRVKNKEKAKVHVGTREPVITGTNNNGTTTESIQYVDVGIKLDVEPNIQLDGTVLATVKLEVSDATYLDKTSTGTTPIRIRTTNAETTLVLRDGERTIIGGLFEQNKTRNKSTIPILGDIPILGSLFTHFDNGDDKKEILLSITPHIVKKVEVPSIDVAAIWSGGEDNFKNGPNFGAFAQPLVSEFDATRLQAAPAVKPFKVDSDTPVDAIIEETAVLPEEMVASEQADVGETVVEEDQTTAETVAEPGVESEVPTAEAPVAEEVVPTEEIPQQQEIGPPIVLEMPEKITSVGFDGPQQVEEGKEFTVAVQVKDIENLYSAPLFVSYDPSILDLVGINEGEFLKQDGQATVFSSSPNRTTGQVIVGYKQGVGGSGASGSGTLFNMTFKPIATGETGLEINRINFRDPDGVRIKTVDGAIAIEVN